MSNGKDHYRFTIKFLWDFGWIILCSCIMDEDYMGIKIKDNKKSITYSQLRQYIIIFRWLFCVYKYIYIYSRSYIK